MRRHEGHLIGLHPKSPINVIQEERGKEAGEKSWRMPAYGKVLEGMIAKNIATDGEEPKADDDLSAKWSDEELANPFEQSDDDCLSEEGS